MVPAAVVIRITPDPDLSKDIGARMSSPTLDIARQANPLVFSIIPAIWVLKPHFLAWFVRSELIFTSDCKLPGLVTLSERTLY